MLDFLLELDRNITLSLNGSSSLYADGLMQAITSTLTWIPVGVVLLYIIFKNNDRQHFLLVLLMLVLCVFISDQLSNICKSFFERWRPARDPMIMYAVDVVNETRGGRFGFFSAHAANTMSLAVFLMCLIKQRRMSLLLLSWTLLNGYSRIYLGVHYFGDVVIGFCVGAIVGGSLMFLFRKICSRLNPTARMISSKYTESGYMVQDVNLLASVLVVTYAVVAVIATFLLCTPLMG